MPITTDNGKLAVMELDLDWEPGLPLSPGALDQADQQQLLWGFPEVLWEESVVVIEPTADIGGIWGRKFRAWSRSIIRAVHSWQRIWKWCHLPFTLNTSMLTSRSILNDQTVLVKSVSDNRDYLFDFGSSPEILSGVTISTISIPAVVGLTIGTPEVLTEDTDGIISGRGVIVNIQGGTAGQTYRIVCKATLDNGRILTIPGRLYVEADFG